MAEQDIHKQESHRHETHSHEPVKGAGRPQLDGSVLMKVGIIIALLIVAVVSYTVGFHAGSSSVNNTSIPVSQSVLSSNSGAQQVPQSLLNSTPVKVSVGASSYFVLPSEAASLIGPGSYTAYAATTPAEIATAISGLIPSSSSYNVSDEYVISYNTSSKTSFGGLQELLLKSKQSAAIYAEGLHLYSNAFNITALKANKNLTDISVGINLTTPSGMRYSFSSVSSVLSGTNEITRGILMLGHTNNVTVFAQASLVNSTMKLNQSQLAAVVASHLN